MTKTKAKKILDNLLESFEGNNPEFIVSKQLKTTIGEDRYKGIKLIETTAVKRAAFILSETDKVITDGDN